MIHRSKLQERIRQLSLGDDLKTDFFFFEESYDEELEQMNSKSKRKSW